MYKLKSKRGVALVFLMELLLLVGFIALLFAGASNVISNEGKYRALDTKNVALFLERIPSIDGNFYYEFDLYNNSKILIAENDVFLSDVQDLQYKHNEKYYVPKAFQLNKDFSDVKTLHFYKIGNEVFIESEPNNLLREKLSLRTEIPHIKPSRVFVEHTGSESTNPKNTLSLPETSTKDFVWKNVEDFDLSKNIDMRIEYSIDSKAIATAWFNKIQSDFISNGDTVTILLVPTNDGTNTITTTMYSEDKLSAIHASIGGYFR